MDSKVQISILLETYGKLLTDKQYHLLDDYYNLDLSLSEIAENEDITRQAVRDNLKKGENKLFEYEEKLFFMKRMLNQEKTIQHILSELAKIEKEIIEWVTSTGGLIIKTERDYFVYIFEQQYLTEFEKEKFNVDCIDKLMKIYRNRIKFSPATEPYITFKLQNVKNLLIEVQEFLKQLK